MAVLLFGTWSKMKNNLPPIQYTKFCFFWYPYFWKRIKRSSVLHYTQFNIFRSLENQSLSHCQSMVEIPNSKLLLCNDTGDLQLVTYPDVSTTLPITLQFTNHVSSLLSLQKSNRILIVSNHKSIQFCPVFDSSI